ncbi:cytochrome c oxidase [Coemansia sp. RSA 1813]|nr:Cytochrome c oxidase subunit 5B, mitochondrial [Coemansia sp. RSA 1646]KAJ1766753.1 cytochrome c oxidase [Coemansia sp. RSA 1843]KAJ2089398.1 cytochrome c oxidase [Coemansia sp. RSA 986]KAJ2210567.1 cytochrome c oxidase [Coemansia sp. RSA 487]KAJ2568247.1 cytochrome c oxidase [Coemansia sp. RSA 1813]
MFRNAVVRSARLSGRRFQSTASAPVFPQAEQNFIKLSQEEQHDVVKRLNDVMKADWKQVSLEDKKALYYATYGPHNHRRPRIKPGDNTKVFIGVVATIGLSLTISSIVRSTVPKPRTMNKEWQEASNEYAKQRNMNPISGISSEDYKGKGFVKTFF